MEMFLDVGLTVVAFIGIVFLIISTLLLSLLTIVLFKFYRFMKKQKPLFDAVEKLTSIGLLKKRGK